MQADKTYTYQPDADSSYPYCSWEIVVSYETVRGNDNAVDGITINGIEGATAWCGKWGSPIVCDYEYTREVIAWLKRELERSRGNNYGLWSELGAHCLADLRGQHVDYYA